MNARLRLSAAIALAAGMFVGSPAFAVDPGQAAPAFDLPLMDGAESALSDELFSKLEYTFIAFLALELPSLRRIASRLRALLTNIRRRGHRRPRDQIPTTATGSRRAEDSIERHHVSPGVGCGRDGIELRYPFRNVHPVLCREGRRRARCAIRPLKGTPARRWRKC